MVRQVGAVAARKPMCHCGRKADLKPVPWDVDECFLGGVLLFGLGCKYISKHIFWGQVGWKYWLCVFVVVDFWSKATT